MNLNRQQLIELLELTKKQSNEFLEQGIAMQEHYSELKNRRCSNCLFYEPLPPSGINGCEYHERVLTAPPEVMSCIVWRRKK